DVKAGRWDLVQVRDDPWLGLLFGRACRVSRTPFVFQLSHLKEEEVLLHAARGLYGGRASNLIKGLVALALRRAVLRRGDLVLAISDAMAAYLSGRPTWPWAVSPGRVRVLPEGVPSCLLSSTLDRGAARQSLGLPDAPTIVYVGTLNRVRGLELLFPMLRL